MAAVFVELFQSKFSLRIEAQLRAISGSQISFSPITSTMRREQGPGAIIATLVSLGFSIDKVREFNIKSGAEMFQPAKLWDRLHTKFKDDNLTAMLKDVAGKDRRLLPRNSARLLMIVLRNATTDSPWPISSNPSAKYNDIAVRGEKSNLHLPPGSLFVPALPRQPTFRLRLSISAAASNSSSSTAESPCITIRLSIFS